MTVDDTNVPAGWYPDPLASPRNLTTLRTSAYKLRWWDGEKWTQDCDYSRDPSEPEISWPLIGGFATLFLLLAIGQGLLTRNYVLAGCYLIIGLQYGSWIAWPSYYRRPEFQGNLRFPLKPTGSWAATGSR